LSEMGIAWSKFYFAIVIILWLNKTPLNCLKMFSNSKKEVATRDSFQGRKKNVTVLSCAWAIEQKIAEERLMLFVFRTSS
jgi:hypothetical protein